VRRPRGPATEALADPPPPVLQRLSHRSPPSSRRSREHITGIKQFHHPLVGDIDLTYDRLDLAADTGLTLFTYTAQPGSRPAEALNLLGSWAATPAAVDAAEPNHPG
jgi:MmyB-like transcription regulator ligand binding domain